MNIRKIALLFFAAVIAFGVLPNSSHGKIVVGLSSVNVAFLPVYVTEDRGFFKDEGLDVLLVLFNAGATNLQALIGGDVQIMGSAFVETVGGRAAVQLAGSGTVAHPLQPGTRSAQFVRGRQRERRGPDLVEDGHARLVHDGPDEPRALRVLLHLQVDA